MSPCKPFRILLLAAVLAPLAGCETPPRLGEVRIHDGGVDARVVFSERDRALIRDYYAPRHRGLPPGLAKKGKLPPGHAMKLYRNQPLPQGHGWKSLPRNLDDRLSRLPDGYVRIVVGGDIGIMNVRTHVVVDLIEDIAD
jgi:hypothetical protein